MAKSWLAGASKKITITGGNDSTNTDILKYMQLNAGWIQTLATPVLSLTDLAITWPSVTNRTSYTVYVNNQSYQDQVMINSFDISDFTPGTYSITVKAIGSTYYQDSSLSTPFVYTYLTAPTNLAITNDTTLSFTGSSGATHYRVIVDSETILGICNSSPVDLASFQGWGNLTAGGHTVQLQAFADNARDSQVSTGVLVRTGGYNLTVSTWQESGEDSGQFQVLYSDNSSAWVGSGTTKHVLQVLDYRYTWDYQQSWEINDAQPSLPYTLAANASASVYSESSGGGGTCFIAGTQITLADGTTKAAEDITYDDSLLVWNFYTGTFDTAKPLWIKKEELSPCYNLVTFDNGKTIGFVGPGQEIGYHRIYNNEAKQFTHTGVADTPVGTTSFDVFGQQPKIVSQEVKWERVKYYNIITDKYYNLFTNNILTSCMLSNEYEILDNMTYNINNRYLTDKQITDYLQKIEDLRRPN